MCFLHEVSWAHEKDEGFLLGVRKKTEKLIKPRKQKKITEKTEP